MEYYWIVAIVIAVGGIAYFICLDIYSAGKSAGYGNGYKDGVAEGHKNALDAVDSRQ